MPVFCHFTDRAVGQSSCGRSIAQQPRDRRRSAKLEEKRLRAVGDEVSAYLDFALSASGVQRHRFTRELFALSRKLTEEVFRSEEYGFVPTTMMEDV